jgi:hypothetical protein
VALAPPGEVPARQRTAGVWLEDGLAAQDLIDGRHRGADAAEYDRQPERLDRPGRSDGRAQSDRGLHSRSFGCLVQHHVVLVPDHERVLGAAAAELALADEVRVARVGDG